jgi:hypothetical protein
MDVTLREACSTLGMSARQVRYQIQLGAIHARKVGGKLVLDSDELARFPKKEKRNARRLEAMSRTVGEALSLPETSSGFSVRDLRAFRVGRELHREIARDMSPEHPASLALSRALFALTRGCHSFRREDKESSYREARDASADAVTALLLSDRAGSEALASRVERELIRAIAGLIKRFAWRPKEKSS